MWQWRRVVATGVIDVEAVHAVRHEVYLPYARDILTSHGLDPALAETMFPSTLEMARWLSDGRAAMTERVDREFRQRLDRATYWWPWSEMV